MTYEYSPVVQVAHELFDRPLPTPSAQDKARSARVRILLDSLQDGSYQAPEVFSPVTRRILKGATAIIVAAGLTGGIAYINLGKCQDSTPAKTLFYRGMAIPTTHPSNPADAYMTGLNQDNETRDLLCHGK